jgi:hypothetical protein
MDITEFFQQSAGRWVSQRTSHYLALKQTESGKSSIEMEMLAKDDPDVVKVCQQYDVDVASALCGIRVTWDGMMERDQKKHPGSTVIVPIAGVDRANEGKLLRQTSSGEKAPIAGRYMMSADDALTLIAEYETMYAEERIWFASPNLRFRTSTLKQLDGFSSASFYSEIRLSSAKPANVANPSTAEPSSESPTPTN